MNWSLAGWVFIGCAVVLLLAARFFFAGKKYPVRENPGITHLLESQAAAIESGKSRKVVIGENLFSNVYPGLGLHALSALPLFLTQEGAVDGKLTLASADGSLVVFARQIVENRYRDGFSPLLHQSGVKTSLYGPTSFSFTAGFLSEVNAPPGSHLALFGEYGPQSFLWAASVQRKGGQVFAAGGDLTAQAVLFLTVRDLLIGESTYALPHSYTAEENVQSYYWVEDLLRLMIILALLVGIVLKLGGIL